MIVCGNRNETLNWLVTSDYFAIGMGLTILLSAVAMAVENSVDINSTLNRRLYKLEFIFVVVFVTECVLKVGSFLYRIFMSVFDLLLINQIRFVSVIFSILKLSFVSFIFNIDVWLQILNMGLLLNEGAYLRNASNVADLLLTSIQVVTFALNVM